MLFKFHELDLKGAFLIENFYTGDNRGGFTKYFEKDIYNSTGITFKLNETFATRSMKNVVRGLHFQTHHPQAKLVSVLEGSAWDVLVDLRPDSPTYKQWRAHELSDKNHLSFYIPRGFGHGFVSLEDNTIMLYLCDGEYDKETDTGIRYDDIDLHVEWPIDADKAIYSERDLKLPSFFEYTKNPMQLK